MRAASARAISSHRNPATQHGLERAIAWSRQWSAEFPFLLANHLPMILVALHRMGASDERLEAYCQIYRAQNGLVPVPDPTAEITRHNWREFLGQREREGDYRAFFTGEVARLGATPAAVRCTTSGRTRPPGRWSPDRWPPRGPRSPPQRRPAAAHGRATQQRSTGHDRH